MNHQIRISDDIWGFSWMVFLYYGYMNLETPILEEEIHLQFASILGFYVTSCKINMAPKNHLIFEKENHLNQISPFLCSGR